MASNKKTKKISTAPKTGKKKKTTGEKTPPSSRKSKINVRVLSEPENLETAKKQTKEKRESQGSDLNLEKETKKKEEVLPYKSSIFEPQEKRKESFREKEDKNKPRPFPVKESGADRREPAGDSGNSADSISPSQSFNLYRKIAFSFIFLTIILLAAVFYFSFNKVTITLYPKEERISDSLMLEVYDESVPESATSSGEISGVVRQWQAEIEKSYPTSGQREVGSEIVGTVEVINDRNVTQTLVATTRLLSPNDKLFRIEERLDIPPGESREVEIYTEEPGPDMAIGPTEFTIPGLWAGLQDKVYARNKEAFSYEMEVEKFIEKEDIEKALTDIKYSLKKKVEKDLNDQYQVKDGLIFNLDENSLKIDIDAEVGQEVEEFPIEASARARLVVFDADKIKDLAEKKLYVILPQNKKLVSFNKNNLSYSLDNFLAEEKKATIKVSFNGVMVTKEDAEVVDRNKITGLNREQLKAYLDTLDQFSGYKINFTPSFMKTVPRLEDSNRIKINIQSRKIN